MIPITTAEVYTWFFIHVGILFVSAAWMTASALLCPEITARGASGIARRPWLTFIIGFAFFLTGVVTFAVMNLIPFAGTKFIAAVIGLCVILFSLFGAGALVRYLASHGDTRPDEISIRSLYAASLLLSLTWLLPLLGWFVALPVSMILGLGSLFMSCSRRPQYRARIE